jgi:hypothetical protein
MLATIGVLAACLPLLPDRGGPASLLAIAAAVGLPPGIAFGARVVGLGATFEAGDFLGLIGIVGAAAWVVSMVAAARAIGLPAGRGRSAAETFPGVALALAALVVLAGPGLPVVIAAFAIPAQSEVMPAAAGSLGGGLLSVVTIQSDLPVLTLFAPLLLLGAIAYGLFGVSAPTRPKSASPAGAEEIRDELRRPVFVMPGAAALGRVRDEVRKATVPEEYRSILNLRALEKAAAGGRPLMWLAVVVALVYAVNR